MKVYLSAVLGIVLLALGHSPTNAQPGPAKPAPWNGTLTFTNTPAAKVIDFYCDVTSRTLICGPGVNLRQMVTLQSEGSISTNAALKRIQETLAGKQIVLRESGEHALFVVNPGQSESLPTIKEEPRPSLKPQPGDQPQTVPVIKFDSMPLGQVLDLYADLVGRKLDGSPALFSMLTIKTGGPITKTEAISSLEALFALYDLKVVPDGEKSLKVLFRDKEVRLQPNRTGATQFRPVDPGKLQIKTNQPTPSP